MDRDLIIELAAEPLLLSPYSQHPAREQLEKLVGCGWVAAIHYQQGGTIYGLTWAGHQVLKNNR